jgi:hypothetical protein
MQLYVIDTVSQEQTNFVFKYLKETLNTEGLQEAPTRYVGFRQDYTYVPLAGARTLYCYSDNPPSHKDWLGYKKISVDELFKLLSFEYL